MIERMKLKFLSHVSGMCFFWSFVATYWYALSVANYLGAVSPGGFAKCDAQESGGIVGVYTFAILTIIKVASYGKSKIGKSIVVAIMVDMVNRAIRHLSVNIQPRKPMGFIELFIKPNCPVPACGVQTSGYFSNYCMATVFSDPCEQSRIWIVRQ